MSLLNLLPSGITANPRPVSSQLVGQADARQPQHPASGSQVSKISKLMSLSGPPGAACVLTRGVRQQWAIQSGLVGSCSLRAESLGSSLPTRNTWLGQTSAFPPCVFDAGNKETNYILK